MFQLLFNILGYYPGEKSVMKIFAWITDHLIYFVLGVGIVSFLFPGRVPYSDGLSHRFWH